MTTTNESTAIGVFDDLATAENAVHALQQSGFRAEDIGIIGHVGEERNIPTPVEMRTPEFNATGGVMRGGLVGAIIGLLVIVIIPGLGAVSGAGRWFELLGGIVLGAAFGGALFAFSSLVLSPPRARFFARELERGHFIVNVSNPARSKEAQYLLAKSGAKEQRS
jgi:hypothetical protein